jgi:hypothetical protein
MNAFVTLAQVLGAYTLFVIVSFTILFSIIGCAVIGLGACEAFEWIQARRGRSVIVSRLARTTSNQAKFLR